MRRIPKQRDGLGKDETVLDVPIDFLCQGLPYLQLMAEEATQRSTGLCDVDVGDFVEGHKDRRKQRVHQHADAKRDEDLAPTEIGLKPLCRFSVEVETAVQQGYGSRLENGHRRSNHHTQHAPNQHLRQQSEAFLHIHTLTDTQSEHLAKGAQNGELEEAHQQAVIPGGGIKPFPSARDESEAANHSGHNNQSDDIGFLHNLLSLLSASLFCQNRPNRHSRQIPQRIPPRTKPVWSSPLA